MCIRDRVNDMLDLSKLSANTAVMHPQIFCVTDNLIEIVDRIQKFNENQGTNIKLQYDQNVEVCADESKIEQVICNFIYNAINYSSPSCLIRVVQEVNGDVVRISVIDKGIGIKEEDLKVIWERYYRVDKAHKRSSKGSGLGLSIVKGILECHKFKYGVSSKVGEGSTFWFEMPIYKEKE